jgi:hypothetical protein
MYETWPPIFSPGFHYLDLDQIRSLCVDAEQFRNSGTRSMLFRHLELAVEKFRIARIEGELWLDGSFVTTKPDPRDLDTCLRIAAAVAEQGSRAQTDAIDWFTSSYLSHHIDGYLNLDFSVSDPRHPKGLDNYLYWKRQWGLDRNGKPQGIVVIRLD